MGKLFGTDGIRGTVGDDLTTELVAQVGRALSVASREGAMGAAADNPRVVVGRDTRVTGPAIEQALVDGLTSGGGDALLAGIMPTAGVAYLTARMEADAGVVVSASHNPPQDNGVKIFGPGGWKLASEVEERIEELVGVTPPGQPGRAQEIERAADLYIDHLTQDGRADLTGLRVAIDCANGAASDFAPAAFEKLGATVHRLNADGDGSKINEACGALHPRVVADVARSEDAIGITLDGDADRVLLADETGAIIDGDGIIAMLAEGMRAEGRLTGNGMVVTLMSNQALRGWCDREGIRLVETAVGDRHVLRALREHGLVLGGEQAGHIARLDQMTTGDGILIGLDVCASVVARGGRLADFVPFRPLPQVMVNVAASNSNGVDGSEAVRAAVADAERRLGSGGRVLVRASGTEPLIRVMVEAPDEAVAGELAERVAAIVRREVR